jgi:type II secretory pathway predicted ATPase ExeA
MYESFYGLYRPPFAVTPDPSLLYMSRTHREALATIIYGIETRKGFIVVTGEVGTGKTTVIRAFFDQAQTGSLKIIYIFTPQVSPLEMARFFCRELGLAEPGSVFDAVAALQLKLLEIFESGRSVVLMIDEAQLLPAQTLEFLRLLSNFETDTEKLIQIVLVGQSEVEAVLSRTDMRQVNQRVALRARLGSLCPEESLDYVEYRLAACGASGPGQVLSPGAAASIVKAGGGIPRCINILADNVLISGFGCGQRPVSGALAEATIREFLDNAGGNLATASPRPRRFGLRRLMRPATASAARESMRPPLSGDRQRRPVAAATPAEARPAPGESRWEAADPASLPEVIEPRRVPLFGPRKSGVRPVRRPPVRAGTRGFWRATGAD